MRIGSGYEVLQYNAHPCVSAGRHRLNHSIKKAFDSVVLVRVIGIIDKLRQVVQVSGQPRISWAVPRDRGPTCIRRVQQFLDNTVFVIRSRKVCNNHTISHSPKIPQQENRPLSLGTHCFVDGVFIHSLWKHSTTNTSTRKICLPPRETS